MNGCGAPRARGRSGSRRAAGAGGLGFLARGQRGGVSLLACACIAVLLLLGLLAADFGMFLSARQRAQNAADAAALAAVQEAFPLLSSGADPRERAGELASMNGARLDGIEMSRAGERVQVEVSTEFRSMALRSLGVGPERVSARAAAEVDLERLLASPDIWYTAAPSGVSGLEGLLSTLGARDRRGASSAVALLTLQHLGKPYAWGATGPGSFDCSGLVCYVYAQVGIRLPRVTFEQALAGTAVRPEELQPGDLVFFRGNAHVGIYLGAGHFIHAPHTGDVVRISPLAGRSVSACRRII